MVIEMNNNSIWQKDLKNNKYINRGIDEKTDILIIGGGITGLSTSYFLKDTNYKITLIDKDKLLNGVTVKSTAKITYLQGIIYQTLAKNFNIDISKKYYKSQKDAIKLIDKIVKENNISCNYEQVPSVVFTNENKNVEKIYNEKEILKKFSASITSFSDEKIKIGIKANDTYCFNPVKYLAGLTSILKNRINICENVVAKNIKKVNEEYEVLTSSGIIKSKIVIVACHYPFFVFPLMIPIKTYIKREYVNVAKVYNSYNINAINIDNKLYSIRYYNNYLIYTSNSHKLTSKTDYYKNYQKSKKDFKILVNKDSEYTWMNQDIISNDNLPYIGKIDNNLYIATAYNAWGMTNGTIASKIISDLIINNKSEYESLFNPKRCNINLITSSFLGSFSYLKAYAKSIFIKHNPYYIKIKNIMYGVYKDENNKIHYIKLICPHMKCSLVFNKEENTWDCPCHGSRFDIDGKLLVGPAINDLISSGELND